MVTGIFEISRKNRENQKTRKFPISFFPKIRGFLTNKYLNFKFFNFLRLIEIYTTLPHFFNLCEFQPSPNPSNSTISYSFNLYSYFPLLFLPFPLWFHFFSPFLFQHSSPLSISTFFSPTNPSKPLQLYNIPPSYSLQLHVLLWWNPSLPSIYWKPQNSLRRVVVALLLFAQLNVDVECCRCSKFLRGSLRWVFWQNRQ